SIRLSSAGLNQGARSAPLSSASPEMLNLTNIPVEFGEYKRENPKLTKTEACQVRLLGSYRTGGLGVSASGVTGGSRAGPRGVLSSYTLGRSQPGRLASDRTSRYTRSMDERGAAPASPGFAPPS